MIYGPDYVLVVVAVLLLLGVVPLVIALLVSVLLLKYRNKE